MKVATDKATSIAWQKVVYHRWQLLAFPVVLVAFTICVYFFSLSYPFEFDDLANIEKYFNIRHTTFGSIFFKSSRWISYWLNACYYDLLPQSEKFHPFLYRLGNVIFHCLTGALSFLMIRLMSISATKNRFLQDHGVMVAYVAAGLFLLHPLQTQTVSYVIQGQLEGLAGLFIMAMTTCFLSFHVVHYRIIKTLLLMLLFMLAVFACGSKEIIIVAPLLLLLVDWFFVAQGQWESLKQRWWIHGLLFFIITSLYVYFLKPQFFLNILGFNSALPNNIGNVLTDHVSQKITPYYFCISQFKVILHYLFIFIWPFSMSVDYDWKLSRHFFAPDCFWPFALLCIAAFCLYKRVRRNPIDIVSFGILWFFITILPRSSIVPSTELLADYKTYIASVGIFFIFAYWLVGFFSYLYKFFVKKINISNTAFMITFSTILLLLIGFAAYTRNKVWRSPEDFWLNVIKNAPYKARAYNNYGVYLCEGKRFEESVTYFKRAIQLDNYYADPYNNIAVSYASLNQIDLAIQALQQSVRLMPYHPEIYNNLANMFMQKNDHTHVESLLQTSIKLRPHYGKAYYNLGNYYLKINEPEKAWEAYRACCLKADFDNEIGFSHYGHCSVMLKKYDDALLAYSKVFELNPGSTTALINIANIYLLKKDYLQAEMMYRRLLQQDTQNIGFLFELGQSLQGQEKYSQALEYYQNVYHKKPTFAPVYNRISYCLAKLGRKKEAINFLKNFLAASPPEEHIKKSQELLAEISQYA